VHTKFTKKPEENGSTTAKILQQSSVFDECEKPAVVHTNTQARVMLAVLAQEEGRWSRVVPVGRLDIFCFWVSPDVSHYRCRAPFPPPLVKRTADLRIRPSDKFMRFRRRKVTCFRLRGTGQLPGNLLPQALPVPGGRLSCLLVQAEEEGVKRK